MINRPFFHFHQLGFRANPFGALTNDDWAAVAVLPPPVAAAVTSGFAHLQLLGPKGVGKTTTLLKLAAMWQENGRLLTYEYLAEGESSLRTELSTGDTLVLDEAQRLSGRERRRLRRAAANGLQLIISSHTDLAAFFRRGGVEVVTVRLDTAVTPATYRQIIDSRLAAFALSQPPALSISTDGIEWLYGRFGPDLREAEYFLYEVWQQVEAHHVIDRPYLAQVYKTIHGL